MKEQQMPTVRNTRQMDLKKRHTNNSSNDKVLVALECNTKKRQKLEEKKDISIENSINALQNEMQRKNDINAAKTDEIFSNSKVNLEATTDEIFSNSEVNLGGQTAYSSNVSTPKIMFVDKENVVSMSNNVCKESKTYNVINNEANILGEAHMSLLHSYTRDFLFKKIKMISHNHLEMNGYIMRSIFEKLNFTSDHRNSMALANVCRTEIRKTICSRRGYVKRKIGIQITGKK